MVIDDIMISKLYSFELVLDNLIQIYSNPLNTLISPNMYKFYLINNTLKEIKKYNYKLEYVIEIKINTLREQIKKLISINTFTKEEIYNKGLMKLL